MSIVDPALCVDGVRGRSLVQRRNDPRLEPLDLSALSADPQYQRLRVFLLGGPGVEIIINPNEAPLLFDVQVLFKRIEAALKETP